MGAYQTFNQDNLGNMGVAASVTTSSPTYSTGTLASLSLTLNGLLRTDGSGVTQPVSAASLPLPTGASSSANQATIISSLSLISAQLPTTLGQKTSANSLAVILASDQPPIPVTNSLSSTAVLTSVANSTSTGVLLAANAARRGFMIFNDSLAIVFVAFAATSSTTAFSVKLQPGAEYEPGIDYTGVISGISSAAVGACRITEFT